MGTRQHRDIVVIGASAGGLDAMRELFANVPGDLPATFFVVQHLAPSPPSRLPELLSHHTPFRAMHPVHGQEIAPQTIYVAPPDMQMLLRPGYLHVVRGPKENGHRPAVDALFRSAARAYGPRVIGVVLTGYLDCGTAGLLSIKARGGLALAQDPATAFAVDMPRSAVQHVRLDRVASAAELGPILAELVRAPAGPMPSTVPRPVSELEGDELGPQAEFVCPECRGALTEAVLGTFTQFRCHVGHTFSMEAVLGQQTEETERALWAAVRALEESAGIAQRMAARSHGELEVRFAEKYETLTRQAEHIRGILLGKELGLPTLAEPERSPSVGDGE
jgi:two-component system, chemotaxis family, protein-glutamate methylesterase/glutaminase